MKYCRNCGKELEDDVMFCPTCGANQQAEANTSSTENQNPTNSAMTTYQANRVEFGDTESGKSRIVAAILAILLGGFGAHNFYLGKTGYAVAQLLLTLIGWIVIVGPFVSGIWAFVEFIIILCGSAKDSEGLPVTNWQGTK